MDEQPFFTSVRVPLLFVVVVVGGVVLVLATFRYWGERIVDLFKSRQLGKLDPYFRDFNTRHAGWSVAADRPHVTATLSDSRSVALPELRNEQSNRLMLDSLSLRVRDRAGSAVVGTVRNSADVRFEDLWLSLSLHDSRGIRVGQAAVKINELGPGHAWQFMKEIVDQRVVEVRVIGIGAVMG